MLLIVGLGNPGPKYAGHRHNVGFMAVDEIARRHGFGPWRAKFQAEAAEGVIETDKGPVKALALKPQTFMNESGRAVAAAAHFHKIAPETVFVFYDELDLAPGKFRTKKGGGAAGHNGIRSIIAQFGAEFWRGRIGIGHPGAKERVLGHVLSDFHKADRAWVDPLCEAIARALPLFAAGDTDAFQTRVTFLAPAPEAAERGDPT